MQQPLFPQTNTLRHTSGTQQMPRQTMRRKRIQRGSLPVQRAESNALHNLNIALNEVLVDFSLTLGDIAFRFMPTQMKDFLTIAKN